MIATDFYLQEHVKTVGQQIFVTESNQMVIVSLPSIKTNIASEIVVVVPISVTVS